MHGDETSRTGSGDDHPITIARHRDMACATRRLRHSTERPKLVRLAGTAHLLVVGEAAGGLAERRGCAGASAVGGRVRATPAASPISSAPTAISASCITT